MVRNLNAPIFQNTDQYSITIPYNELGGVISNVIEATDADTYPLYRQIQYEIVGWEQNYTSLFSIDRNSGQLSLNGQLRSPRSQYNLLIKASDGGTPSLSSEVTFRVYINFNLNNPVISPQNCIRDIYETDSTFAYTVQASDSDQNLAGSQWGSLIYTLTSSSPGADQYFYMDDNTIMLRRSLIGSSNDHYNFTISVMDGGGESAATTLFCTMNVIRNNFPPNITNLYAEKDLDQNVGQGNLVFTVTATDEDPPV